jgi:aquaporin Z
MILLLRDHWPEYAMEAAGLGLFMVAAGVFGTLLFAPLSPVAGAFAAAWQARACMGLAMGLSAVALIYSSWGQRSGAHLNPAVTLTFLRLQKIAPGDAAFYILAQFLGGAGGVALVSALLGAAFSLPPVRSVVTVPGSGGPWPAFVAEALIAFAMMLVVLLATNSRRFTRATGVFAGTLVALYITVEAPLSGMSMNPARTFASALAAGVWTSHWLYWIAPLLGMLAAAEVYTRLLGARAVHCAKLVHGRGCRCIFRCRYGELTANPLP